MSLLLILLGIIGAGIIMGALLVLVVILGTALWGVILGIGDGIKMGLRKLRG